MLANVVAAATLAGCTSVSMPPEGDELGAPLPTPEIALAASGATRMPVQAQWQVGVPPLFRNGAGVFALGDYFVLTAIEAPGPQTQGNIIRLFVGDSATGAQLSIHSIPKVISQPFIFAEKGRPMALVDTQADPESPVVLNKIDLLQGRTIWTVPAGLGADKGRGVQFRAVAVTEGNAIGQVVARGQRQSECGVCAVSLRTGEVVWTQPGLVPPAGTASLSTVVAHGMVGTQLGELTSSTAYLLDAGTGGVLARMPSSWTIDTMQPPVVLTADGMVALERPEDGLRSAVAVNRNGRRTWRLQIRRDPVVATDSGLVVLPLADGSYRAATVPSGDPVWVIPAEQADAQRFIINVAQEDRLLGASATTAVVLAADTGLPIYAEAWFNWINPNQWDGRTFLGWTPQRELASFPGSREPVGMEVRHGGEEPIFVVG